MESSTKEALSKRLVQLRTERGWTQNDLVEKMYLSQRSTLTVFQLYGRHSVSQAGISFTDFFKLLYFGLGDILAVRKPFQDILHFRRNRLSRQFVYHCYHPLERKKAENALRSPLSANI